MNPKITNEALEAYCYCAQKFHLKLRGEQGVTTDYERMRAELRANTMARAIKRYLEKQEPDERIRLEPIGEGTQISVQWDLRRRPFQA